MGEQRQEAPMLNAFSTFADLASFIAAETKDSDRASHYGTAFLEHDERAKLSPVDDIMPLEMPDPDQSRAAVEMVMATLFDVFRDTRLEPFTSDLAWGFVNSFHVVAKRLNDREAAAAQEPGALARSLHPSQVYAQRNDDTQHP